MVGRLTEPDSVNSQNHLELVDVLGIYFQRSRFGSIDLETEFPIQSTGSVLAGGYCKQDLLQ